MFDIAFTSDTPELQEDGWRGLEGRIILGDYQEGFLAPVDHWPRAAYERQWVEAAHRLLGPSARAGFFTSAYRFWWTMWREGDAVHVHEEYILPARYAGPHDGRTPYEIIADRRTVSDDGRLVSEWRIGLDDVRAFVERRRDWSVPA